MNTDILKEISHKLTRKGDINLTFSSTSSDFTTPIYPPLQLEDGKWVVGLASFDTYYSFANINETNNDFTYSVDGGTTWKKVLLPVGCYEISEINSELKRLLGTHSNEIDITANTVTLGSVVNIPNENFTVDFSVANSIASVLGFNSGIIEHGRNESPNIVNILSINSLLINCDIIGNSYMNGSQSPIIYSFFPNVRPGVKIVQQPTTVTFLPIIRSFIESMRIWVTDQNGNVVNFRGEEITIRMILKYV